MGLHAFHLSNWLVKCVIGYGFVELVLNKHHFIELILSKREYIVA